MTDSFRPRVTTEDLSLMTFHPRDEHSVNFFYKKERKREKESNLTIAEFLVSHTGYLAIPSNKKHLKFLFKWVRNMPAAPESFRDCESL